MVRILKRRLVFTLAACLVAAACGALAGLLLEAAVSIRGAERELDRSARRVLAELDGLQHEALTVLAAQSASPFPVCSEAELSRFRSLIFRSKYLRDAGRMREGRILCSAVLGRENLPASDFKPSAALLGGQSIYIDVSAYTSPNGRVLAEREGDSYVVIDPDILSRMDQITAQRALTTLDAVTHKPVRPFRELPVVDGVVVDRNWQGRAGQFLLLTRCSTQIAGCMTTYITFPQLLRERRGLLVLSASLGAVTGTLFGLLGSLLYRRNRGMAQQLRRAIAKDKLRVVYQPIVDLNSRQITGAEALARWTDEEGFAVPPDVFVRVAEERGFVGAITRLVLRHAVRDFAQVLRSRPDFRLSINVTAFDLGDKGFLPMLDEIIKQQGVAPQSLALEITESSTAHHDLAVETIAGLRQRGFSVHVDDFGTGYSSLSYLHALSIDAIKIDKSFTRAIGTEAVTLSILPQILAMAEALKLEVIVEGVETELQAEHFRGAAQPVSAQGWHFGRPVPAELFHALLADKEFQPEAPAPAASTGSARPSAA